VAVAGIRIVAWKKVSWRVWVLGAICAVAPDADVIGERVFTGWGPLWTHHALMHSILAASVVGLLAASMWTWRRLV
jgi:inner membrane protein